ncbi:MAG: M3 family oligoendopeptidase [Phycisphaerae bacterium]|nr:M3 family oligoendopeptidase [Phycisphaerae bacterium]
MTKAAVPAVVISAAALCLCLGCRGSSPRQAELRSFIDRHVDLMDPLNRRANLALWAATTQGRAEDYNDLERMQLQIRRVYSSPQDFAFLKSMRESGQVREPRLRRQLDKLYLAYLQNQMDPDLLRLITELDTRIQRAYNDYRGSIGDQKVTMSEIYTILTTDKDVGRREQAWRASKQVGNAIAADLIRLVRLRNQAAQRLGFDNYHTLAIVAGEQDLKDLDALFADLDRRTAGPFARMKAELDQILAAGYGIPAGDLRPWHYHDPFFQRTPLVYELDLDAFYKGRDIEDLTRRYYAGVGLPVDDILARSDLYDRPGKDPHAFGQDMDRHGDARVLANLQDTERWMETLLHETGHALYSKYHDPNEPWLLREPAHNFTTEAIAMFFGRLSRNAAWMAQMLGLSDAQRDQVAKVSARYLEFQQVLFIRWALVMFEFEKQLYANPDQDLNGLWWDLVERYQLLRRPPGPVDAGWASKLHFVKAPCYYHNYVLGEILASQLDHYLVEHILNRPKGQAVSFTNDPRIGRYLRTHVLGPGARYTWQEMIRKATGEPLTPRYFVEQFVRPGL